MTFVQLEYVVAVDICRHFAMAANRCYVTQPTLSMQIQKLEEELGVKIFDRSKQPVVPTEAGVEIIEQARKILAEKNVIQEIVQNKKGILTGELRIGIIPTLAPYLLPLFVQSFAKKYPHVKLIVQEMLTEYVISRLREGRIDVGIVVTPLQEKGIKEHVLFYEELLAYVAKKNVAYKKTYVLAQDIDPEKLWLMEEGHCFRSQIVNLCELRKSSEMSSHFEYEAGSIEALRRMVELNDGITILPELTTLDMDPKRLQMVRHFQKPAPMREVSLVVHRDFVKKRLIEVLKEEVLAGMPDKIRKNKSANVVPI
ncbi:hydrogen peroxide-inducible genes activator [Paraflavitalea pollutisoli]|uniref:hydrogen peroxide-inducible genes activator n=1 Tax=Paraflavitalea pollutisoli TaxID=3034143 RepID=UPI0023EB887F|nr:hydrogen peroxide-inducible genes activator [Paraflavitalea sp. H1-2-19X]